MNAKKFTATIEVAIIVDIDDFDTYDEAKRVAILRANMISNSLDNAKLIEVEAENGMLTTKIY